MMIKKQTNGKDRGKSGLSKESGSEKRRSRSAAFAGMIIALPILLAGCGDPTTQVQAEGMKKVGSYMVVQEADYTEGGETEEVLATFTSSDNLCEIRKYASYYEVTLDYRNGTPSEVGAAYARTIRKASPDYEKDFEPYLYENIRLAFSGRNVNYTSLEKRIMTLFESLPDEYKEELAGFAREIAQDEEGYEENGKLSYVEAITMQMIPDALRQTACSALSIWGSKTESGERLSMRNLEWNIGSKNQISALHTVLHMNKGERSITSIGMLGLLDIITAVSDDGVMVGILDVGSRQGDPYIYEGKKCYTFDLRYALEQFTTAKEVGEYMVGESGDYTWCHNLFITDKEDAFCAEDVTSEVAATGKAKSVLRSAETPIHDGLSWDSEDSLCIVNSFATKGNQDGFTNSTSNLVRFVKYNNWVKEKEKFDVADFKGIMAKEIVDQMDVANVHSSGTVHTVILDYATGKIQVAFTTGECADDIPRFLEIGHY